uniref:Uncharacterized protein MANES_01G205200 n=1 Tax=Rhizophora mucronata TaxID=61149 RepID=A0A2P2KC27_RHIMU
MFDVVKSPWMRPPSCNFPIASPICFAMSSNRSSTTPCKPNSRKISFTEGPSTYSNVRVFSNGSTEYNTGVETPSRLAFVMHLASAFKRLRVSLESNVGCRYFFEKRSLTTDLLPTKVDLKTLASAPCLSRIREPSLTSSLISIKIILLWHQNSPEPPRRRRKMKTRKLFAPDPSLCRRASERPGTETPERKCRFYYYYRYDE